MKQIIIFDTTLRDGEQSPGASMNISEKLLVARQLELLGVDVIEAGFPIASQGDFEAVSMVAKEIKKCVVCGLARAVEKDIQRCALALKKAKNPRIHTFIATSPIHRKSKLKMSKTEVIKNAVKAVKLAKSLCNEVEFSAEDATRTELEFLKKIVLETASAGADVINIPDTVGYSMPTEYAVLINEIRKVLPDSVKVSVHCHNDLGMASSNSLVAILNGADQVECTVNGLGERAGNASMEEIVMGIATRKDIYNCSTKVKTEHIFPTSSLVSKLTGIGIQKNKAIIGENAFRHEAGIHQHGVIQDKLTYEIMTPESIGRKVESLVLGKHSGRHAIAERLKLLGINSKKIDMDSLFLRFKELADKKKEIFDDELVVLATEQMGATRNIYELEYIHTLSGSKTIPSATVKIKVNSLKGKTKIFQEAAAGDGPVDACYKAINKIIGMEPVLIDYNIKAISKGGDSLGEVSVVVKDRAKKIEMKGRAASTDIIEASALAYLSAINKIKFLGSRKNKLDYEVNL